MVQVAAAECCRALRVSAGRFYAWQQRQLYLVAIMGLHSRFIVGWALSAVNDRHLTLSALDKALERRFNAA